MKTTKLRIIKITLRGEPRWQVVSPKAGGGRTRKTFKTEAKAKGELAKLEAEMKRHGLAGVSMPEALRVEACEAQIKLAAHGATIRQAVEHYIKHLEGQRGGKTIAKAVEDFLAEKKGLGLRARYLTSLSHRLSRFAADAPKGATTASLTTDDMDTFLRSLGGSTATADSYRRNLHVFFEWCRTRKPRLCEHNPVAEAAKFKPRPPAYGTIAPGELAAILSACDERILAGVVLGAFCGIRQAEIERLRWECVDLKSGRVKMDAGVTKTNSRRVVTIPTNALEWLAPVAKKAGPIWPEVEKASTDDRDPEPKPDTTDDHCTRNLWAVARIAAGFGPFKSSAKIINEAQRGREKTLRPWPENALRHTAISARLAMSPATAAEAFRVDPKAADSVKAMSAIAYECGTSPAKIQSNYNALLDEETAVDWFNVRPVPVLSISKTEAA
jgi:integrase